MRDERTGPTILARVGSAFGSVGAQGVGDTHDIKTGMNPESFPPIDTVTMVVFESTNPRSNCGSSPNREADRNPKPVLGSSPFAYGSDEMICSAVAPEQARATCSTAELQ